MKMFLLSSLLFSSTVFAADTIKLSVATQTYQCSISGQDVNCNPVNQVQTGVLNVNKNGGQFQIADQARGLSLDGSTVLKNGKVVYSTLLCSNTVCTANDIYSDANGAINQLTLGQYNLTESSFYVLGVSLTNAAGAAESDFVAALKNMKHPNLKKAL